MGETVTSTLLDTEFVLDGVWDTDAEEDWEGQLEGVFETRELLEIVPTEVIVEACVAEYVSTGEAETIGLSDCNGDCVWEASPDSLDDPIGLGVIEFKGDPELLWAFELDGLDEYDTSPLGDPDTVNEFVSKEVDDSEIILDWLGVPIGLDDWEV